MSKAAPSRARRPASASVLALAALVMCALLVLAKWPALKQQALPLGPPVPPGPVCAAAMERLIAAQPATQWPPPCPLSAAARAPFERAGLPFGKDWCLAQRYEGTLTVDWSEAVIDAECARVANGTSGGTYGANILAAVRRALGHMSIAHGSTGMVCGAQTRRRVGVSSR